MRGPAVLEDWNAVRHWNMIKRVKSPKPKKTPRQLFEEFEALANDFERWQWVKENKAQSIKISLDNDSTHLYIGDNEDEREGRVDFFVDFSDTVGRDRGIVYLLESLGIPHDYWD